MPQAASPAPARALLSPIQDEDVDAVAAFLERHLNARVPARVWAAGMQPGWQSDAPNHGFQLRVGGEVVGANLAFYSRRAQPEGDVQICNLGALCVLEPHRAQTTRLMRALLKQPGYTFTDLSPSGTVPEINKRLGFTSVNTASYLVPNLPWPPSRQVRVVRDREEIGRLVTGREAQVFADHQSAPAAVHLLIVAGDRQCYVVARRDRRKNLPLFASVLHVSDQAVFARHARAALGALLRLTGAPFTLLEQRVVGAAPRPRFRVASPRPKMVKTEGNAVHEVDYLYSELTQIPW